MIDDGSAVPQAARYEGTANLEAMANARNYNRFLVRLVESVVGSSSVVADFGAGIGTFAEQLRPKVAQLICIEPDENQARQLRELGFQTHDSLNRIADESLDAVYTLNVLEHIGDDVATLSAIRRKLRNGGRLLVYVPAFPILFSDMDRLVGHVRRYRLADLAKKVRNSGFRVDVSQYVDAAGFFATLAYRAFGSGSGHLNPKAVAAYDRYVFPVSRALDALGIHRLFGKNALVIATAVHNIKSSTTLIAVHDVEKY